MYTHHQETSKAAPNPNPLLRHPVLKQTTDPQTLREVWEFLLGEEVRDGFGAL